MVTQKHAEYSATGRRKDAVARVRLVNGGGAVTVNGRKFDDYFPLETLRNLVQQPLKATNTTDRFDIKANVSGGGIAGQAGAMRHGIARALTIADQNLRAALKDGGFDRVRTLGLPYDPNTSEAIQVEDVDDPAQDGLVIRELVRGYRLDEHIVRAARVVVGRCVNPPKEESGETLRIPTSTGETLRPEEATAEQNPDDVPPEDGGQPDNS